MSLATGTRLAHYEILEAIGKGGMGEVYRAKDSKLGRDVAIKVLPEEFAENEERLARFKREAKVLASLNHPNIASIYGLEQSGSTHYLVLELVPGETLAERISRGPVQLEEAFDIATQMAEALEEAHEQGIVHRDLKPANVKQTEDGKIKVLDYGLAKVFQEETPEADSSMSPTLTRDATRVGVILGTAAYMSPEQAKGKRVDKRADIWAFGVVLYEMLTGERAFAGEDVSDTLAHVLTMEPGWGALPADLSPTLRMLLTRCLEKDPKRRLPDIGVVRLAMDGAFEIGGSLQGAVPVGRRPSMGMAVAAALLLSVITGIAVWQMTGSDPRPRPVARFSLPLPPAVTLTSTYSNALALSPDGTRVVYSANNQLYTRTMDQTEATPVRGTEGGAEQPFFSPTGEWVGFWAGDQLKKVAISGGVPVILCGAHFLFGARWGADDTVIFGLGGTGILRVSAEGGTPEVLVPLDATTGEVAHGPQVLPGDKAVLFTVGSVSNWDNAKIVVHSLESSQTKTLIERGRGARYVGTGHLVYVLDETLWAAPFDVDKLEVTGSSVPMVNGVLTAGFSGGAHFSVSDAGSLIYVSSDLGERTLVWVDRQGNEEALAAEPRAYANPDLSRDGRRLALRVANDIWTYDLARSTFTRLSSGYGSAVAPRWSPDGRRIVFSSGREGIGINLFLKASDGTGEVERLTTSPSSQVPSSWSSDGQRLLFYECSVEDACDLWMLSLESEPTAQLLLQTESREWHPVLSPDGRWFAYVSDVSGRKEVFVRPFPDAEAGLWPVSTSGGEHPVWGPQGRELVYWGSDGMMAVPVEIDPTFTLGNPELLFDLGAYTNDFGRNYAMTPDGERFLMVKEGGAATSSELILILNWFEVLKQRVPTNN